MQFVFTHTYNTNCFKKKQKKNVHFFKQFLRVHMYAVSGGKRKFFRKKKKKKKRKYKLHYLYRIQIDLIPMWQFLGVWGKNPVRAFMESVGLCQSFFFFFFLFLFFRPWQNGGTHNGCPYISFFEMLTDTVLPGTATGTKTNIHYNKISLTWNMYCIPFFCTGTDKINKLNLGLSVFDLLITIVIKILELWLTLNKYFNKHSGSNK